MEELERLDQLEKVFNIYIRILDQKNLLYLFDKWKALSKSNKNER